MSDYSVGTLTVADIDIAHEGLRNLVSRGWVNISTVEDRNDPETNDDYQYLVVERIGGPPFGVCFNLGRNSDGSYSVSYVRSHGTTPTQFPRVESAGAAADQIVAQVEAQLHAWVVQSASGEWPVRGDEQRLMR